MKSLLREWIRCIVKEAMVTADAAASQKLGLMFVNSDDNRYAILYAPHEAAAKIREFKDENDRTPSSEELPGLFQHSIKGMIMYAPAATGECYGAWEIMRSAAEKGYGPLLYYIAAASTPKKTIMPDRNSTSAAAGGVWQKFAKGAGGAKALQLDDEEDPKTPPTYDDCKLVKDPQRQFLDYAYRIDSKMNISALTDMHDEFVATVGFEFDDIDEDDVISAFKQAAKWYFESAYL